MLFTNEKIEQYKQILKTNNVVFENEEELKSVLNQMYVYKCMYIVVSHTNSLK